MEFRMKLQRQIGAVVGGLLAGVVCVGLIEWINVLRHPMPEGLLADDLEGIRRWVDSLPTSAFVVLLVAWAAGCCVGTYAARRIAANRSASPALVVWGLLTAATIFNLVNLPHPAWLWPAAVLVCVVFGLIGLVLAAPAAYVVQTVRRVRAPIEKVFKTIASIEEFSKAVPGIIAVEFLTEQQYGIGTRFRETRNMQGKEASTELAVTELVDNKSVRMVSDTGGTVWDTLFTVAEQDEFVELTMQMDVRPHRLSAKFLAPMILGMVRKAVEQDMDSVKSYSEASMKIE